MTSAQTGPSGGREAGRGTPSGSKVSLSQVSGGRTRAASVSSPAVTVVPVGPVAIGVCGGSCAQLAAGGA